MRKIAVNQILKHRMSVTNEEKKLNEYIEFYSEVFAIVNYSVFFLQSVKCTKSLNYIKIGVPDIYARL